MYTVRGKHVLLLWVQTNVIGKHVLSIRGKLIQHQNLPRGIR
jgi:hypothetical protein